MNEELTIKIASIVLMITTVALLLIYFKNYQRKYTMNKEELPKANELVDRDIQIKEN